MVSRGDVAHGSVDGDGPDIEAIHHLIHLMSVIEGAVSPQWSSVPLKGKCGRNAKTVISNI